MKKLLLPLLAALGLCAPAMAQQNPVITPQLNSTYYVKQVAGFYPTIQSAVTKACGAVGATVDIPAGASPADTIGAVTDGCTTANIVDERDTPATTYHWDGSAYVAVGGGGGATLPTNALVYGLSSTTSRAATTSDVATLIRTATGCNVSGNVWAPQTNTCITPSGGGGSPAGSTGAVQTNGGSGAFGDSGCTASSGLMACPNGFAGAGSTAAALHLGQGTAPSVTANAVSHVGPTSVSTAYNLADPGAPPTSSNQVEQCTNASGQVTCTWATVSGGGSLPTGYGIPTIVNGATWGPTTQQVPVEAYGAVGYSSQAAAVAGTDSTTAIQNCLNSLTYGGQCTLQALSYKITAPLVITTSGTGLRGVASALSIAGLYPTPSSSVIITTSASTDILDVHGTGTSANIVGNQIQDLTLLRSVAPTGSANGLYLNYSYGVNIQGVTSCDSKYPFHVHASGNVGPGSMVDTLACFGLGYSGITYSSGTYAGIYMDSADGVASPSFWIKGGGANVASPSGSVTVYGMQIDGAAINDLSVTAWNTGFVSIPVYINYTGGGGIGTCSDLHFINGIHDQFLTAGYSIHGVSASCYGSIDIDGGWLVSFTAGTIGVDIEDSNGVSVRGVQIYAKDTNVKLGGTSTNNIVTGNVIFGTGTNGITVSSGSFPNTIWPNSISGVTNAVIDDDSQGGYQVAPTYVNSGSAGGMAFYGCSSPAVCNLNINNATSKNWNTGVVGSATVVGLPRPGSWSFQDITDSKIPLQINSDGPITQYLYGLNSTADAAPDTGLSRCGVACAAIGNGTVGDRTGSLQLGTLFPQVIDMGNSYGVVNGQAWKLYNDGTYLDNIQLQTNALQILTDNAPGTQLTLGHANYNRSSITADLVTDQSGNEKSPSGGVKGFTAGLATAALDTGFSRCGAACVAVGNGTAGNASGTINAATYGAGTLANGMIATTQSASDNSTKVATTAYFDRNFGVGSIAISSIGGIPAGSCTGYFTISVPGASGSSTFAPSFVTTSPSDLTGLTGLVLKAGWDGTTTEFQACNVSSSSSSVTGFQVNVLRFN